MRRLIDRLAQPPFALAVLAAAIAPMLAPQNMAQAKLTSGFPGWPQTFEGRSLTELALTKREIAFAEDFPGRIARFSDGRREIILRWVATATRRLHPASDCFKGLGYSITPSAMQHAASGNPMSCFRAERGGEVLEVCEQISAASGSETWPDVSSWYWPALLGRSAGPWWSVVAAEHSARIDPEPDRVSRNQYGSAISD